MPPTHGLLYLQQPGVRPGFHLRPPFDFGPRCSPRPHPQMRGYPPMRFPPETNFPLNVLPRNSSAYHEIPNRPSLPNGPPFRFGQHTPNYNNINGGFNPNHRSPRSDATVEAPEVPSDLNNITGSCNSPISCNVDAVVFVSYSFALLNLKMPIVY